MAAEALKNVEQLRNPELHVRNLSATIADASYTVNLPPGFYRLAVFGTQTNAGADGTLLMEKFINQAQTVVAPVYGEDVDTAIGIKTAIDLEAANDFISLWFSDQSNSTGGFLNAPSAVWIPYGLKITIDINAISAIDVNVAALRVAA